MKQIFLTLALGGVLCAANTKAQQFNDSTIVVTANKFAQSQKQAAKVVQVITQQQIQLYAATTVSQLLNNAAGFYVAGANGAAGSVLSVFNRGASAGNTLILINGLPVQDASGITQQFDINQISVSNIERIEICKQAQSTLYGSDAVAGVVNIITKKNATKPINFGAELSAGSFNSFNGAVNISGQTDNTNYFVGYSKNYTNGISSALDTLGNQNFENDVFKKDNLQASLTIAENKFATITFTGLFSQYKAGIDNAAFKDEKDYNLNNLTANAGINAIFNLNANNTLHAVVNGNFTERKFFNDNKDVVGFNTLERSNYVSKTNFKELYWSGIVNKNTNFTVGIEHRKYTTYQAYYSESAFGSYSTQLGDSATIKQTSIYANVVYNYKNLGFDAGIRLVNHQLFGNNTTFSFNPYYNIKNIKIFGSLNTAFVAPSPYQLFATPYNNKNLQPETSVNTEIGAQINYKLLKLTTSIFSRNIKNAIQFVRVDNSFLFNFQYLNFAKQVDNGIEINAQIKLNNTFNLTGNYTYVAGLLASKFKSNQNSANAFGKDSSFNNLYRRPNSMGNISLNYSNNKNLTVQLQGQFVGKRLEPRFNAKPLPLNSYTLVNLIVAYNLNKIATINLQGNNLLNAMYQENRGYTTLPTNILVGFKLNL